MTINIHEPPFCARAVTEDSSVIMRRDHNRYTYKDIRVEVDAQKVRRRDVSAETRGRHDEFHARRAADELEHRGDGLCIDAVDELRACGDRSRGSLGMIRVDAEHAGFATKPLDDRAYPPPFLLPV